MGGQPGAIESVGTTILRSRPDFTLVDRRGPILRPSPTMEGVYGLDLTAGCAHGCPFCYIRGSRRYPGEGRVLFDPRVPRRLDEALERFDAPPRQVVLSPSSDPLPPIREVRRATGEVVDILLRRGIETLLMTRGRLPRAMIARLADAGDRARVAIGLATLDPHLARRLEPGAASPAVRLRGLGRLVEAGVPVEVRLEPLVADLNDTPEAIGPIFSTLARIKINRVVAHYLFLHTAMVEPMEAALAPLALVERVADRFEGGPIFAVGSLGTTKHLPLDKRRDGFARLAALGAEYGLTVETGAAQNPDLPRAEAGRSRPISEKAVELPARRPVRARRPAVPGPVR
jgi:DNA repair photolyase